MRILLALNAVLAAVTIAAVAFLFHYADTLGRAYENVRLLIEGANNV